jgi:hypothetical protein
MFGSEQPTDLEALVAHVVTGDPARLVSRYTRLGTSFGKCHGVTFGQWWNTGQQVLYAVTAAASGSTAAGSAAVCPAESGFIDR